MDLRVDATKMFGINPSGFFDANFLSFKGQCRWVSMQNDGSYRCGLEIKGISDGDLRDLRIVIQECMLAWRR